MSLVSRYGQANALASVWEGSAGGFCWVDLCVQHQHSLGELSSVETCRVVAFSLHVQPGVFLKNSTSKPDWQAV